MRVRPSRDAMEFGFMLLHARLCPPVVSWFIIVIGVMFANLANYGAPACGFTEKLLNMINNDYHFERCVCN